MQAAVRKFILQVILITILLLAAGYLLFFTLLETFYFRLFPLIPLLVAVIFSALHIYLVSRSTQKISKFIPHFMLATGIKLLLISVMMITLVLVNRNHAVAVLITFIITYLVYTTHEVASVLKYLKNSNKS